MQATNRSAFTLTDDYRAQIQLLKAEFIEAFGERSDVATPAAGRIRVIRAPGRVNLIGEHTDYNDGFVFPMAIEPEVRIVCRTREDGKVRLASTAFVGQLVEFSVQQKVEPGEPSWANYCRGVAAQLIGAGIPLSGMDALISNTLPLGGGLSSSAAIETATGLAFLTLAGLDMERQRLALVCQKAEHTFAGVPCGIMDQTVVAGAQAGHAMLLDCRDLSKQHVQIDPRELQIVIVNSMVKHALTGGEYAERRAQCEEAVKHFQTKSRDVKALRDVTPDMLEAAKSELPELVYRRARHVVTEIARTVEAATSLSLRRYEELGAAMLESHASLKNDFDVSTPELDFLVEESMKVRGVYGARMTGAGFGGCIIALVQPRAVQPLQDHLTQVYTKKIGKTPEIYVTTAHDGASVLE